MFFIKIIHHESNQRNLREQNEHVTFKSKIKNIYKTPVNPVYLPQPSPWTNQSHLLFSLLLLFSPSQFQKTVSCFCRHERIKSEKQKISRQKGD